MRTASTTRPCAKRSPPASKSAPGAITFITIPLPPSVNALYRNLPGKGRVKTQAYKDWAGRAGWILKSQNPQPVPGRVVIVLSVERNSAASDIDNRSKAVLDLLVDQKIIKNDNLVTALATVWAPSGTGQARVAVVPSNDLVMDLKVSDDKSTGGWFLRPPEQEGPAAHGD
jgi:Holliday junction resolvase RusA-like endonuclease